MATTKSHGPKHKEQQVNEEQSDDLYRQEHQQRYRNTLGRDLAAIESQLRELNRLLTRLLESTQR